MQSHREIERVCPSTVLCSGLSGAQVEKRGSGRQNAGLVLDPTNRLHLVGVSLGAVLVVVSVLALASVSLQNVLVATVTRELVGHPAAERERGGQEGVKVRSKNTIYHSHKLCQTKTPNHI